MEKLAILADVESPAEGDLALRVHDAIGLRDRTIDVREHRVVGVEGLRELRDLLDGIDARREVGDVELPDFCAALTERLAFLRSPTREGLGEPGQDDDTLASVLGQ
ncbi:MAG: hypothetical protein L6R30_20915, partial [Thermoanaerobaculia bacterium]|nr:hypothetical protein [Thermoanaerobaculia bacterium]